MTETWLERVKARAVELDMTMEELARTAKLDRSYFRKIAGRPNASPRGDTLARLAKALKLDPAEIVGVGVRRQEGSAATEGPSLQDVVPVPEVDVKAGAGGGGIVVEAFRAGPTGWETTDGVKDHWGLPNSFLRYEARIAPDAAHILEIVGDSMVDPSMPTAPGTLMPGDRAILDTRDTIPSPPGNFAVWDGFGVVVKMIEIIHGSEPPRIRLSSRNPAYQPYDVLLEEARILGRVRGRITIY